MDFYISHEYGFAETPDKKAKADLAQARMISAYLDQIEGLIIDMIERESRDQRGNVIYYTMSEHPKYGQYLEIARMAAEWRKLIGVYWNRANGAGTFELIHNNTIPAKVLQWEKSKEIAANL